MERGRAISQSLRIVLKQTHAKRLTKCATLSFSRFSSTNFHANNKVNDQFKYRSVHYL